MANSSNRTTITLDEETKKQLKILCIEKGFTLQSFIRDAIHEKMEKEGKELAK